MRHTTTFARWLAGLNGAAVVLAFAYYMQTYLSILSIKDDCVARLFVADAIKTASMFVIGAIAGGLLAMMALVWPVVVGGARNAARAAKGRPLLQRGQEFDELSEFQAGWISMPQIILTLFSVLCLLVMVWFLLWFGMTIGGKPEGIQKIWHELELRCVPQSVSDHVYVLSEFG
jgi:hypothetical protein